MGTYDEILNRLRERNQNKTSPTTNTRGSVNTNTTQPNVAKPDATKPKGKQENITTYPNLSMLLGGIDQDMNKAFIHYSKLDIAKALFAHKDKQEKGPLYVLYEGYIKSAPADKKTFKDFVENNEVASGFANEDSQFIGSYQILEAGFDLACKEVDPKYDMSSSQSFVDGINNNFDTYLVILDRATKAFVSDSKSVQDFNNPKTSSEKRNEILKKLIENNKDFTKKPITKDELNEAKLRHHNNTLSTILKNGMMSDIIGYSQQAGSEVGREGGKPLPKTNPLVDCLHKYIVSLDKGQEENNEKLIADKKGIVDNNIDLFPDFKNQKRKDEVFGTYYPLPPDLEKFAKTMKPYCGKNIIKLILKPLMKAFQKIIIGHSVQEYNGNKEVGKAVSDIPAPYKSIDECEKVYERYDIRTDEFGDKIVYDKEKDAIVTDEKEIKNIKAAIEWVENYHLVKKEGSGTNYFAGGQGNNQNAPNNPTNGNQPKAPAGEVPSKNGQGGNQTGGDGAKTDNDGKTATTNPIKKVKGMEIPQSRFEADCFLAMSSVAREAMSNNVTSIDGATTKFQQVEGLLSFLSTTEYNEEKCGKKDPITGKDVRDAARALFIDISIGNLSLEEISSEIDKMCATYSVNDEIRSKLQSVFKVVTPEVTSNLLSSCSKTTKTTTRRSINITFGDAEKVPFKKLSKFNSDSERRTAIDAYRQECTARYEELKKRPPETLTKKEKDDLASLQEMVFAQDNFVRVVESQAVLDSQHASKEDMERE